MWVYVFVPCAVVGSVAAALWFRRVRRGAGRGIFPTVESVIRAKELTPGEGAMLSAICAGGRGGEPPAYESAEVFDRRAAERVRDALSRGGDARGDAEQLRRLRRSLGFPQPPSHELGFLAHVVLIAPTGERSDGIVIRPDRKQATIAAQGPATTLRPGVNLTIHQPGSIRAEDIEAPVTDLDDRGAFKIVRLDLSQGVRHRRAHLRLNTDIPAEARIGEDPHAPYETATVVNVSREGARVQLRLPHGAQVNDSIHIRLQSGGESAEAKGRIAWARKALLRGWAESVWVVGVEFPASEAERWSQAVLKILSRGRNTPGAPAAETPPVSPEVMA